VKKPGRPGAKVVLSNMGLWESPRKKSASLAKEGWRFLRETRGNSKLPMPTMCTDSMGAQQKRKVRRGDRLYGIEGVQMNGESEWAEKKISIATM